MRSLRRCPMSSRLWSIFHLVAFLKSGEELICAYSLMRTRYHMRGLLWKLYLTTEIKGKKRTAVRMRKGREKKTREISTVYSTRTNKRWILKKTHAAFCQSTSGSRVHFGNCANCYIFLFLVCLYIRLVVFSQKRFLFFGCVLFVSRIINTPRLDLYVEKCCHWIHWYERFLYACAFCSLNELFYHTLGNRCLSRLTQQTSRCVANVKNKSLLTIGHI